MDFEEFLKTNNIVKAHFCKKAKISYQYLQKILNRRSRPSLEVAKRMEEASEHKVSVEEILDKYTKKTLENVCRTSRETENKIKKLCDRMAEVEMILEKVVSRSQLNRYHLDFIQQIIERDKDLPTLEVLESYRENINELIEREWKKNGKK